MPRATTIRLANSSQTLHPDTRADFATRREIKNAHERWEASTKPVPHVTFTQFVAPGQSIQVNVENLGGTLAGCGMIVQSGDEWTKHIVPTLLALLVYGVGLGYVARFSRGLA